MISVLIHNSSEYQNVNSCTVSIYFQQIVDKLDAIMMSCEIIIVLEDDSSNCELNEKKNKVRFKEIAKLFRSARCGFGT